jgi:hypothetical protein
MTTAQPRRIGAQREHAMPAGIEALDLVIVDGLTLHAAWHPYAGLDALLDTEADAGSLSPASLATARVFLQQAQSHGRLFALGFLLSRQQPRRWTAAALIHHQQRWWRVQLESLRCANCGWQGLAANPCEPSLYYAHEDWRLLVQAATEAASCPCPRCAAALPRRVLWAEERADWER